MGFDPVVRLAGAGRVHGDVPRAARSPLAALLAALRISRRDALRSRGRSALIVAMVGLPVLVITVTLIFAETADITPREGLTAQIGAADLRIWTLGGQRFPTRAAGGEIYWTAAPSSSAEIVSLLGHGARVIPANDGSVDFRGEDGYDHVAAHELDLRDPLTAGMYRLLRGRLPAAPEEIAVTPGTEERGAPLGTTPAVGPKQTPKRVVGVVEHPHQTRSAEIVGFPGTLLFDGRNGQGTGWLADTSQPITREDIRRLNTAGLGVRAPVVPEGSGDWNDCCWVVSSYDVEQLMTIGLAVVMSVLEVVLLAGPAFAVGLRRRRRELALIAAQGGAPGHLRMIVFADGVVLGGGAALLGLILGVGLGSLAALLEAGRLIGGVGPLDIPWRPILIVTLLGAVSGITAAVVPAVQAARQDVAAVLGGRRSQARDRAGRPVLGLILLVVGAAAAVFAVRFDPVWVLTAAVLAQLGLVALAPALVGITASLAARLPLPFRLAARDASRHRGRTASAVAAVMTAAAAFTAVAVMTNSNFAVRRDSFQAALPEGTMRISGPDRDDARWTGTKAVAERMFPEAPLIEAAEPLDITGTSIELAPLHFSDGGPYAGRSYSGGLPVGGRQLLELVQGRRDPAAAAALDAGKAVAFDPRLVRGGRMRLHVTTFTSDEYEVPDDLTVPAVVAEAADPQYAVGVLPASALHAIGLKTKAHTLYIDPAGRRLDREQEGKLERELAAAAGGSVDVFVQGGLGQGVLPQLALFLAAASVLVLGGTFAATGLAAADLRPDLATMAAVGAPPGTRRLVVAGQAGFIAGLGALVGALAGIATGIAAIWPVLGQARNAGGPMTPAGLPPFPSGAPTIEIPWLFLVALVVGLPMLAALVAGAFTRTGVTLTRRVT
ncbi:FtsX-like permease family protein [Streptosporangium roseum]|uniref:FtsX-like permease family protein n=1 Tax=Streptosporangium roseum TaxID=2001 RepID=UPI0004CD6517|nr:FtsX-like permease family protein [Streptosporangium roseum]